MALSLTVKTEIDLDTQNQTLHPPRIALHREAGGLRIGVDHLTRTVAPEAQNEHEMMIIMIVVIRILDGSGCTTKIALWMVDDESAVPTKTWIKAPHHLPICDMTIETDMSRNGLDPGVVHHTGLLAESTGEIAVDTATKIETDIAGTLIRTGIAHMGMMTRAAEVPETSQ
jgi:hypothetical protein